MRKIFTILFILFSAYTLNAQELIRNGNFATGVSGSAKINDIDYWAMDMENPASGWWSEHAGLTSTDTTLYQVVEKISADSVLYTLTFSAKDTWISGYVLVTAAVTGADSTQRETYQQKFIKFDQPYQFKFGFSKNSAYVGKRLVIGFDIIPNDTARAKGLAAWCDIDNVSMTKVIQGVNTKPTAVVGQLPTVKGGTLVTLDGSGSTDPEGTALNYNWVSVYPGIKLSSKTVVKPTFTAPKVTELSSFQFALFVDDGELMSDTVIVTLMVLPEGELIRNGDFEAFVPGAAANSASLKDVAFWNIDMLKTSLAGGRWGAAGTNFITLASKDTTVYQVLKKISSAEGTYTLTFSARSSWNAQGIKSIFSVSGADSTVRTSIDSKLVTFDINPSSGVSTTTWTSYTHVLSIPANSPHVGKQLIIEFDNIPYDDGTNNGWLELDNISLIEKLITTDIQTTIDESISVYPNPANSILNIQSNASVQKVEIYSIVGKLEKTVINPNIRQIGVDDLKSGLYFISMTTGKGVVVKKVVIE